MMVIVILTMVMFLLPSPYEHHMGNNALTEEEEIMDSLLTELPTDTDPSVNLIRD